MNPKPDAPNLTEAAVLPLDQMRAESGGATPKHRDCAKAVMQHGLFQRFCDRVQSWFEVPYGFEDETGFHYGRLDDWDRDHVAISLTVLPSKAGPV